MPDCHMSTWHSSGSFSIPKLALLFSHKLTFFHFHSNPFEIFLLSELNLWPFVSLGGSRCWFKMENFSSCLKMVMVVWYTLDCYSKIKMIHLTFFLKEKLEILKEGGKFWIWTDELNSVELFNFKGFAGIK